MNQHERALAQQWAVKVQGLEAEIERQRLRIKDLEINSPAQDALREIERLNKVIKRNRLCDPRYCTFGNAS